MLTLAQFATEHVSVAPGRVQLIVLVPGARGRGRPHGQREHRWGWIRVFLVPATS